MSVVDVLQPLVAALDERGEPWELHRAATGDGRTSIGGAWVVSLGDRHSPNARTVRGGTIGAALEAALACPPLPVYPRRPRVYYLAEPHRSGSKWASAVSFNHPTKRAAEAANAAARAGQQQAVAEWDATYGPLTHGKVEGVDFRWRD